MLKKVLPTGLILFGMLFFGTAGKAFADAAALLEQAERYANTGYCQQEV